MKNKCTLTKWGAKRIQESPIRASDILLVSCMRNESIRLPWFLDYHRQLGVDRFLIVDNQSDDGTSDLLDDAEDVIRFLARGNYSESACGIDWTNDVSLQYATGHWVLTVDADELLYFPGCERCSIKTLAQYLDRKSATAFRAPLLDMYSKTAITEAYYTPGENPLDGFNYFDATGYRTKTYEGLTFIYRGGARERLFWRGCKFDYQVPVLMKIPFLKWDNEAPYGLSTHTVTKGSYSAVSGILLHFKFLHDFPDRVVEEVRRKEHFMEACQYKTYLNGIKRRPELRIYYRKSTKFEDSAQLVKLGFMHAEKDFYDHMNMTLNSWV